jgi:hypothetical protein
MKKIEKRLPSGFSTSFDSAVEGDIRIEFKRLLIASDSMLPPGFCFNRSNASCLNLFSSSAFVSTGLSSASSVFSSKEL